ncbi:MAG TPA: M56 family metallopeptidase [Gemmataceae bacterium]|jgi:beta-lactamase regulating signal transducer with metallopeptidase domain
MNVHAFNDWSTSAITLAVAIVWQSALLASIVAGVCWLLRRSAPALRYWCWQIVALKLLLMPWWIVALPLPVPFGTAATGVLSPTIETPANPEGAEGAPLHSRVAPPTGEAELAASETTGWHDPLGQLTWHSWLVLVWLGGIAWQIGRLLVERSRLRRLLNRATVAAEPCLLSVVEQVAVQLGLSRRPDLLLTDEGGAPFVCGLLRPVLVLPRGLMAELDPNQWREVLLHELGHLKRCDLWWGWIPALARLVYFFHPVAHWVAFRIRLERELACDQLAMTQSGCSAADYAEVLVRVVSHASMPAELTMSSLEGLSTFWRRRLTMLLSTKQSSPRISRFTVLVILAAALVACLLPTLRYSPVQGQPRPAQADAKAEGRIYVSASLRLKDEDKNQHNQIIAIDPATGKWQKIADGGSDGRVSPDGKTLVFSRFGKPDKKGWVTSDGIWSCDTAGSDKPVKISDKSGRPVWSYNGKHLVATKQENLDKDNEKGRKTPAWRDETWQIDADGSNPVKLPIPDTDSVEDWSPDGQWFVTSTDRHPPFGSGYQLYLMKTDGTQERRLTKGGLNVYSRFSPDGKKILFLRQTAKEGNSIWTMDVDGKNAKEIVKEVDLASPNGAFWSPDGKQIAVSLFNWERDKNGRKISHAGSDAANYRIEIMDADGTNRRQLKLQGAKFVFIGSLGDWR